MGKDKTSPKPRQEAFYGMHPHLANETLETANKKALDYFIGMADPEQIGSALKEIAVRCNLRFLGEEDRNQFIYLQNFLEELDANMRFFVDPDFDDREDEVEKDN